MPLTADQLAQVRAQWNARMFPDTGTVMRVGEGTESDEFGLPTSGTETIGVIACSLRPDMDTRTIQEYGEAEATLMFYRLRFAFDADIESDDVVTIGGDQYRVVALWDDHSERMTRHAIVGKLSE